MSSNKVNLCGKEYTMKDVSILRTKMTATKSLQSVKLDEILEWIGNEAKEKESCLHWDKFVSTILIETYEGLGLLDLPEREVTTLTSLFFESATVPMTKK